MINFNMLPQLPASEVHFLCIGTDRSTGDALGPLVGTALEKLGYNVTGTIKNPCHAINLAERALLIPKDQTVVAIDACLGEMSKIGEIAVAKGALSPGAGVGKDLGSHGQYSITGVVNVSGFAEFFVLQNTRLSIVMDLAERIVGGIHQFYRRSLECTLNASK